MLAMIDIEHPHWSGFLIRREALPEVGFDPKVAGPCDLDFELRLAGRFPIYVSREPGAILVYNDESFSATHGLADGAKGWSKMIKNIAADEGIPAPARAYAVRALTKRHHTYLRDHALWAVLRKQWTEAKTTCAALMQHYRWDGYGLGIGVLGILFRYFLPARYAALMIKSTVQFFVHRKWLGQPAQKQPQEDWSEYERFLRH
jgi:hypothetical protein